ncbi:ionotropic receptor 21a-like [Adelges cooleyi]|uniref:ionotropic receptor 21a-like n=1 Tax=Adelges cooleyi TaxID=133065 RepID=UPI0021800F98|nr:ionotropic receptor 21a-like [Adelges cooleyi]
MRFIWTYVKKLWETFKVYKISLLHKNELQVLKILDKSFHKYRISQKLNYGMHNAKGYPLNVVMFNRMPTLLFFNGTWYGPDWESLQMFVRKMNFTLNTYEPPDRAGFGRTFNGTYTGSIGEVAKGRADIAINSRFLDDPVEHKPYRYSFITGLDFICFVVPRAKPASRMQMIWKTFTVEVWVCLLICYVTVTVSFRFWNKCSLSTERKIPVPSMTTLQVLLGMSTPHLPKHITGRLLFVTCSAAFFVVVSLFQASMVTKLSVAPVRDNINTLQELDQSGIEIRTSITRVKESLATYELTKSLADKIETIKDRSDYLTHQFSFAVRVMSFRFKVFTNYVTEFMNNSIELHVVQECPLKYYLTYAVALDFPFLDELNDVLKRLHEAGLNDKWKLDIRKLEEQYYKPLGQSTQKTLKAYSLYDLWFAFLFLFGGYLVSFITLMFELTLKSITI